MKSGVGLFFGPQGHNLTKLSRGSLDDANIHNIKALDLVVSDKKIFYVFLTYKPM